MELFFFLYPQSLCSGDVELFLSLCPEWHLYPGGLGGYTPPLLRQHLCATVALGFIPKCARAHAQAQKLQHPEQTCGMWCGMAWLG